jgi:hypothetical protein
VDGTPIPGATSDSYLPTESDAGRLIYVQSSAHVELGEFIRDYRLPTSTAWLVQGSQQPEDPQDPEDPKQPKGKSSVAPGKTGTAPGLSGNVPGKSGDVPGKSGSAPGLAGTAPGKAAK